MRLYIMEISATTGIIIAGIVMFALILMPFLISVFVPRKEQSASPPPPMMSPIMSKVYFWGSVVGAARGLSFAAFSVVELVDNTWGWLLFAIISATVLAFVGGLVHFYVPPKNRKLAYVGVLAILALNYAYEVFSRSELA
jgi:hypothetical protein